jgi:branched-chain amino acid transport system permease protein
LTELFGLVVAGLVSGSIYALLSLGFAIAYWPSRHFHFAYAGVFLVASYAIWWANSLGLPFAVAAVVSVAFACFAGVLCYRIFYRPIENEFAVFLTAFALAIIIQNISQIAFSADAHVVSLPVAALGTTVTAGPFRATILQLVEIVVCVASTLAVIIFIRRSRTGVAIRGLISDQYLTECVGIDAGRLLIVVYALGSGIAAIAAILLSLDVGINPTSGTNPLFFAINGMLLGGRRNIVGAPLGGFLLGMLVSLAAIEVPAEWGTSVAFGLLLIGVLVRPQGLLGRQGTGE